MTTYTVQSQNGAVISRHVDLEEAATTILQDDGYCYEIQRSDYGFDLLHSRHSQNASGGPGPMVKTVVYSVLDDEVEATADIYQQVVETNVFGAFATPDTEYDTMLAHLEAEEEDRPTRMFRGDETA